METFTVRNLSFSYPEQERKVLNDLSFAINEGEFVTLCGPSGCGKSTLLRQLKTVLAPHGTRSGSILFQGEELDSIDQAKQSASIGFVQQSPENQIVTDKVWHELAFGLESLGYDNQTIRSRVAEMASFFGIQTWFYKDTTRLSGGQKQLLNLASIMVMHPTVLILDEPTSQLDPIAASDFLTTVGRINREFGTTVIMTEHRLEEVFPMSDRVLVMDKGHITGDGTPAEVGSVLKDQGHSMFLAMPAAMRVWAGVDGNGDCPVTVRDGRDWLEEFSNNIPLKEIHWEEPAEDKRDAVIEINDAWFRYERDTADVVKGLNLRLHKGEFLALLGGNGTGKTTSLGLAGGLRKPYRGEVIRKGSAGILPQNPQTLFVKRTVREDLYEIFKGSDVDPNEQDRRVARVVKLCRLTDFLDRHPYDISGGEQQRAALAKVLLLDPEILLLDEPTKGLDAEFKQTFAAIIRDLKSRGVSILMVSHDVEFCAEFADRCALFFDGNVVSEGRPADFFSGNSFYTTAANRMSRGFIWGAVTVSDLIRACGGEVPPGPEVTPFGSCEECGESESENAGAVSRTGYAGEDKLPAWRKALAWISGAAAAFCFVKSITVTDLTTLMNASGVTGLSKDYLKIYALLIIALVILAASVSRRSQKPAQLQSLQKGKLPRRTIAAAVMILLLIPLTIWAGVRFFGGRKYYFIALLILLETMAPFALIFEGRKPQARELVLISTLCAIGVAGRAAFFMLPNFKPVLALVIICGVALGGETGFLIGAMTMLVSNVIFGQGPWTPWQMFAMGVIGFLAGVLYKKGLLRRNRLSLCIFGALSAIVIYGGIMNPAAALIWAQTLNKEILISYYLSGFPVDLVHASATVIMLWLFAESMLEKLDRIKVKYGLVE